MAAGPRTVEKGVGAWTRTMKIAVAAFVACTQGRSTSGVPPSPPDISTLVKHALSSRRRGFIPEVRKRSPRPRSNGKLHPRRDGFDGTLDSACG